MVPNRSHVLVLVSVFYVGKCYEKIRKDHVILLAPEIWLPKITQKFETMTIF